MKNNCFLKITTSFFISFFIFGIFNTARADFEKIVFINKPQSIPVGTISAQYNIQLQDSNGNKQPAPFTVYYSLPFDIGEFSSKKDFLTQLNSSSNVYTSTGDYNKYFYFRSNNIGKFNLKVIAKNKDGSKTWQAEQEVEITSLNSISSSTQPEASSSDNQIFDNQNENLSTTTINESNSTTTSEDQNINQNSNTEYTELTIPDISTHSEPEELSDLDEKTIFKTSAGRSRIAYIGELVKFHANYKISGVNSTFYPAFDWSFGDGLKDSGQDVSHAYKYAGDYNIVLDSAISEEKSVSRTKIRVLKPQISIKQIESGIEITNNGKYEINLGDWTLSSTNNNFTISKDTILGSGKKINISFDDSKIFPNDGEKIYIKNPSGKTEYFFDSYSPETFAFKTKIEEGIIKNKNTQNFSGVNNFSNLNKEDIDNQKQNIKDDENIEGSENIQTASALQAINNEETKGFFRKIFDIPISGIKSFFKLFYKN